jgi:PAS domain S-box-containing protein
MTPVQVLCVDDDESRLELTETFLERESDRLEVLTATTADDALDVLEAQRVDCVVSDYDLDQGDGLAFLRTVREDHPDVPFVLFTAKGTEDVAAEAISAGVTDYLQKGGREGYALLANRVENAVDAARAERELERAREKTHQLHDNAAEIAGARSRDAVIESALAAADDILEFSVYGIYEAIDGEFHPVGDASYDPGERPAVTRGVLGTSYQHGESAIVDDARTHDDAEPHDDAFRAALSVPIGDDFVFQAISKDRSAFTETDLELTELLGTHVEQALDRIEREREHRETKEQLEAILENTTAIVYAKDLEGRYELVNERFQEVTGLDESEMLGKTDWEIQDDEYAAAVRQNDRRAIEEERAIEVEEDAYHDGEHRTLYSVKVPLFDDDGEPKGVCGISSDITELKRREAQLERQRNRLDEFASVLSHDLRGPLSVAEGYLELVQEPVDDPRLEHVSDAHERMRELIEDVLALAREGEAVVDPGVVDAQAVAESAWSAATPPNDVELVVDVADDAATLEADRGRLSRLFENCFRNAIEHGDAVSTITVTLREDSFAIADDGAGIPPGEREDVFDFGVTTSTEGTGIGLAVVREIADAHDWSVRCEESDAGGAKFVFDLAETAPHAQAASS